MFTDASIRLTDYSITSDLQLGTEKRLDPEVYAIADCQWIRGRQYFQLEGARTGLFVILCVRWTASLNGDSYVALRYINGSKFQVVIMRDHSDADNCQLRTLSATELNSLAPFIIEEEHHIRTKQFVLRN